MPTCLGTNIDSCFADVPRSLCRSCQCLASARVIALFGRGAGRWTQGISRHRAAMACMAHIYWQPRSCCPFQQHWSALVSVSLWLRLQQGEGDSVQEERAAGELGGTSVFPPCVSGQLCLSWSPSWAERDRCYSRGPQSRQGRAVGTRLEGGWTLPRLCPAWE